PLARLGVVVVEVFRALLGDGALAPLLLVRGLDRVLPVRGLHAGDDRVHVQEAQVRHRDDVRLVRVDQVVVGVGALRRLDRAALVALDDAVGAGRGGGGRGGGGRGADRGGGFGSVA